MNVLQSPLKGQEQGREIFERQNCNEE
jgi:hypothetical protein